VRFANGLAAMRDESGRVTCNLPCLWSYAREASVFHIANVRFWQTTLMPIAVIVVVALSSCTELLAGEFISLNIWYAANFYVMSYTVRTLHPQLSVAPGVSWSVGIAVVEMAVKGVVPSASRAVGTTLYACGCVWMHASLWGPSDKRSRPDADPAHSDDSPTESAGETRVHARPGTCAAHVALAAAVYALLLTWWCVWNSVQAHTSEVAPMDGLTPKHQWSLRASKRRVQSSLNSPSTVRLPTFAWSEVLLGSVLMMVLWLVDRSKTFEFSIPYILVYNLVCMRVPDLLGNWVMSTFGDAQLSVTWATTVISFAYMGAMQVYVVFLRWVCHNMSARNLFPRFLFVAQMYYYLFWYMMLMVVAPVGVEDWSFWVLVAMLNGNYLVSNLGAASYLFNWLQCRRSPPDAPLKILFDAKLAVQDQLADIVSLLVVPAVATCFQLCANRGSALLLWQRFGALLLARLVSGLLTEEIFRRRLKSDVSIPDEFRIRYLNDCDGTKLGSESLRNIERCELYFAAVAVLCTFAVFHQGGVPARYAFIAFGT